MHDSWKEWWYRVLDLGDPGMIEGLVGFESGSDVVVGWRGCLRVFSLNVGELAELAGETVGSNDR